MPTRIFLQEYNIKELHYDGPLTTDDINRLKYIGKYVKSLFAGFIGEDWRPLVNSAAAAAGGQLAFFPNLHDLDCGCTGSKSIFPLIRPSLRSLKAAQSDRNGDPNSEKSEA